MEPKLIELYRIINTFTARKIPSSLLCYFSSSSEINIINIQKVPVNIMLPCYAVRHLKKLTSHSFLYSDKLGIGKA